MAKKLLKTTFSDEGDGDDVTLIGGGVVMPLRGKTPDEFRDLRGDAIVSARPLCQTTADYCREIGRLWLGAQQQFLEVGRTLNEAKLRLAHGEFGRMLEAELPFSYAVGHKLMQVAAAVEAGTLPRERLPPYSVAYQFLTLKPDERAAAVNEGLVRPDVRREEILEFKRKLRTRTGNPAREAELIRKLQQLLERRRKLDEEIALVKQDMARQG